MNNNVFNIPTGYLFTTECDKGILETLSIGDYGKKYNVKADFLGFNTEINGVPDTHCMPLSEKWVITVSTQYGCPMRCNFCDVPNVKFKGNASFNDLKKQFYRAISFFPSCKYTERLNLHFARMGEPIFNENVFDFAIWCYQQKDKIRIEKGLRIETLHPVLTTSLPKKFKRLEDRILWWCEIKNDIYNGQAGLQFSINTTSEEQRNYQFGSMQIGLDDLSKIANNMPIPKSRKYCLNFAYSSGNEFNGEKLADLFDTDKFMVKITPIHNNYASKKSKLKTIGGYENYVAYREIEEKSKKAGFDTLVFIPSLDEEKGLVTCGNLILGGSNLQRTTSEPKIIGI